MSSYIDFYVKKYGVYIPIASYSRSSTIYQAFEGAPYGKVSQLKLETINDVKDSAKEHILKYKKEIEEYTSKINLVRDMSNSVEEKMQTIYELQASKAEYECLIQEEQYAISFFDFLIAAIDSYFGNKLYYGVDAGNPMVIEWDKFGRPVKQYKVEVSEEEVSYE